MACRRRQQIHLAHAAKKSGCTASPLPDIGTDQTLGLGCISRGREHPLFAQTAIY